MKFKYFIRGLGIGIIFTSIICLTAYQGNASDTMTDAEIIRRAKELGMVEADNSKVDALIKKQENQTMTTEPPSSEQPIDENTEEKSTEQQTKNPAGQESSEQPDNQDVVKDSDKKDKDETVEITVTAGTTSYDVCQKLQELGLIENAARFDDYLIENGYANRIRVGTHKLTKGMDSKAIAEAISDPI
ncbi:MAG: hypothetical protein K2K56_08245 [Lachnospiraceae bacterium]|nr:hypothetical protein [Lachnospiraceae bacterium]